MAADYTTIYNVHEYIGVWSDRCLGDKEMVFGIVAMSSYEPELVDIVGFLMMSLTPEPTMRETVWDWPRPSAYV